MSNQPLQSNQNYDKQSDCLEKCLQELSPQERQLIEGYYQGERSQKVEKRKQLAARMGIGIGELRVRVHRLRRKLNECIRSCIDESEPEEKKK